MEEPEEKDKTEQEEILRVYEASDKPLGVELPKKFGLPQEEVFYEEDDY